MKRAVVLLNLGGPLQKEDIKPFLFNFFMDKNIISAPLPLRWALAKWISFSRSRGEADSAYRFLGFKSPLLENTQAQADALQNMLGEDYKVFVSMRYWHPMAPDVVRQVKDYDPDEVILLPLYPQFSTTTSFSSFEDWDKAARMADLHKPVQKICCYPAQAGFISASVKNIRAALDKAPENVRLLFSAHGLPEKIIEKGDPYQYQCEKTAEEIFRVLNIPDLDWQICYQSKVGPLKWIGPSTEEALDKAIEDKKGVIIYPHAFVSEHVETLVEIDIEYREMAEERNISYFGKVETVGAGEGFIQGLAAMVKNPSCPKICPDTFKRCGYQQEA